MCLTEKIIAILDFLPYNKISKHSVDLSLILLAVINF